jgi:hypothetical protein
MTPRSLAIRNFCYLPFYPAYFGTDVPGLRLALHRIANNPRTSVYLLL